MKYKKNIVTLLLAASILLGLPGCKKSKDKEVMPTEVVVNDEQPINDEVGESLYDHYKTEIMAVVPNYKNLEYYLTSEEVKNLTDYNASLPDCPYTCPNLNDSIEKLVDQIKSNSKLSFWNKNSEKKAKFPEDEEYLSELGIEYFLREALTAVFSHATNNIAEDLCTLSEYKIALSSDLDNGSALADCSFNFHTITLYYERVKNAAYISASYKACTSDISKDELYKEELRKTITNTLIHEINHARQNRCKHALENTSNKTIINYSMEGPSFLCEASAESALYNLALDNDYENKRSFSYSYSGERAGEGLLFLMGITNDSVDDYYNAIYDSDLEALYKYFRLETEDEIEAFYRILYALDSINKRSKLGSADLDNEALKIEVGNEYLIDVLKITLKNMIDYTIKNPDMSLEDNVTLFKLALNRISEDANFVVDLRTNYYGEEFIKNFNYLRDTYLRFLCEFYNTEVDLDCGYQLFDLAMLANNITTDLETESNPQELLELFERYPVLKPCFYSKIATYNHYDFFYIDNSEKELNETDNTLTRTK